MTRQRLLQPKYIDYIVQVTDYRLSYTHSLIKGNVIYSDEAWDEHYSIQIQGKLLASWLAWVSSWM